MADELTHFDASGAARMVSVGEKPETARRAHARARVTMQEDTLQAIEANRLGKGDALAVARIAAISGVKGASTLVPLCHPIRVTGVDVRFSVDRAEGVAVVVDVEVLAVDRTGPEMEALAGAAAAGLALIDMAKAIDKQMAIEEVLLLGKSGGKSGDWRRDA
jgi:cyclic pyranopterin phosphate synthase